MRFIDFDPDRDLGPEDKSWWESWTAKAQRKRDELVAQYERGEAFQFDGAIWSDLKKFLHKRVFHGKCAYCEAKYDGFAFGEAEHYRPKKNVTVRGAGGKVVVTAKDTGKTHPGYFWLAYHWKNLLPSCDLCNNIKSDQFPVGNDHAADHAKTVEELKDIEDPLLLNPFFDEPSKYLRFGRDGVVVAIDDNPYGKATIEVFGLDRREIVEARKTRQEEAMEALPAKLMKMFAHERVDQAEIDKWLGKSAAFSAAVQFTADECFGDMQRMWAQLVQAASGRQPQNQAAARPGG